MNSEDYRYITTLILGSTGASTTIILFVVGFMWNRMDKRFDRLENKIDTLFNVVSDHDKRIAILENK